MYLEQETVSFKKRLTENKSKLHLNERANPSKKFADLSTHNSKSWPTLSPVRNIFKARRQHLKSSSVHQKRIFFVKENFFVTVAKKSGRVPQHNSLQIKCLAQQA